MKLTLIILMGWALSFFFPKKALAVDTDSLYTFMHVLKVHITYPDSAFYLLDEIAERHPEKQSLVDAHRGLVYASQQKYRLALPYSTKALKDDQLREHPQIYLQTVSNCAESFQQTGKSREALDLIREGIDFARQQQNVKAEASLLFTAGQIYYQLGKVGEAYNYFHQAIRKGEESMRLKPFLSYFYGELSSYLAEERRYEEALAVCGKRERLIQLMSETERIPLGYIDQQYAYLYGKQATFLAKLGRTREAEAVFQKFLNTRSASQPAFLDIQVAYQLTQRRYRQVIQQLSPSMETTDTIQQDFANYLSWLAEAHTGVGESGIAYQLMKRHAVIADSLTRRKQQKDMAELATIFQLKEKDLHILEQENQLKDYRMVRAYLMGGLGLLVLLLLVSFYHTRTVKQKNRLLVSKINRLYLYRDQVEQLEKELMEKQTTGAQPSSVDTSLVPGAVIHTSSVTCPNRMDAVVAHIAPAASPVSESKSPASESGASLAASVPSASESSSSSTQVEYALYKRLDRAVKEEKLYLNPNLNRQELAERFSLDKTLFSRLLQEHAQLTLPQYLADLRIKYAIGLMRTRPNYTFQAIAEESGFTNLRQFQRAFKAVTGMTPSEYKLGDSM